ncbi:uncharacterized protein LOC125007692 isoform X2 [Mugil cephalus]|uniref:uncharacterized protein LOC125007692 isoform X2 n=1 Tax=Mugil cephalus TaxID=48193 RepID=UPI001FB833C9|nr:uncharacterized protein LOC125007692 isoform X2 [Mugil cephalus]
MIVLWFALLFLHPAYTLVPVKTVELGKPTSFTCVIPKELSTREIHWYKQSAGDTMNVIVTLWKSTAPEYASAFKSRFNISTDDSFSNLTILWTIQEDEGMYHCAFTEWIKTKWSATYLIVKGKTEGSSSYTVVQTVSDPVRPGDSVTLQCSVLSDSEDKTCPEDFSVFWFRAGSHKSHPKMIYTDGDTSNECERRSDTQNRCVYRFSKDVSSSDAGTYYCAVATCGEILFGNGTNVNAQESSMFSKMDSAVNLILSAALTMSLIVIVSLLCTIKEKQCETCKAADVLQKNCDQKQEPRIYSAAVFTAMKAGSDAKKAAEKKRIYTALKAFGLD